MNNLFSKLLCKDIPYFYMIPSYLSLVVVFQVSLHALSLYGCCIVPWIIWLSLSVFFCCPTLLEVGCLESHALFKLWEHHGFIKWHNGGFAVVFHPPLTILTILFSLLAALEP